MPIFLIILIILLTVNVVLQFTHYMHMFQLGGYHANVQLKWLRANIRIVLLRAALVALPCILQLGANKLLYGAITCLMLAIAAVLTLPKKAKKKLVYTPRVLRMCVCSVLIYGVIALVAHLLPILPVIGWLLLLVGIVTPFVAIIANFLNKPIEAAINRHYINDAKRIIDSHSRLVTIGITGSYGKTSTKYFLNTLLSSKFNVLMTPESYNTTMGVVKTVRGSLSGTHEIFICEMGAKGVGEIKEICDIVKPKHSMITSIGAQHLESFKTIENIISTKFEIADCITDGTVFLNYDNEYIRNHKIDKNTISYGIGEGENRQYYATNISVSEKGTSFTLNAPNGESAEFETVLLGAHNVENIVGAIAIAHFFGISLKELYLPVKRLESVPHRLQLHGGGQRIVIDDAFNSNPSGARAALDVLKLLEGTRFLVTPGMIELGEKEYELNRELGEYAAERCEYAVLIGEKQAVPIKEGLLKNGFDEANIFVAKSLGEGMAFVDNMQTGGRKIILLENDLPDNY